MLRRCCLAILVLAGSPALAEPTDNPALAEQLFAQGRALAKANNWAQACPKFEASLRYDPTLGTRLNLATCYEKIGRLASAWGLFRESAELAGKAGDAKRKQYAVSQAAALEPRLPRLTIDAPPNRPPGFAVTRDGAAVDAGALGTSLYVDPGSHEIVASAPGFEAFTRTVSLQEKRKDTVVIPPLVARPQPAPAPEPVVPDHQEAATTVVSTPTPPRAPPSRTMRLAAIGAAAVGVVATGVGMYFGGKARSTYSQAKQLCGSDLACGSDADFARAQQLVHDARSQAAYSTGFVIVGGAAIAGGITLWLLAPSHGRAEGTRVAPAVTPHSAGLVLQGGF